MNLKNITTIVKKELSTYFNSPTAYIVIIVFLLLWEFLFFRNAILVGEASLRILMNFLPWLFIILIPALTMGSISQEKSDGTLELLLTHPLNALELVIGKFIASTLFISLTLLFIFPIAYSFDRFGDIDWGIVYGQYFASVMLSAVMVSLGIFISSLFASPIASLLVGATSSFFLIISGFEIITLSLPSSVANIFERLSALTHFDSMSRGVIDLRDLWYFFSITSIFLSLSFLQILKLRLSNQENTYRQYITGVSLFIAVAVLVNIVGGRIPGRIDLTQDQMYQLTDTTKKTVGELDDVINIKLFATQELPSQLRPVVRDIKDTLRDYQTISDGKIKYSISDPNTDPQSKSEAGSLGIREVQFNVIGQEEFQLKKGYLGMAILFGGQSEIIPFISDTSDLEYQITSSIIKLTTTDKKSVAFLTGHGEKVPYSDYRSLTSELEKLYDISEFAFDEDTSPTIPNSFDTLVVAGPTQPIDEEQRQAIADFVSQGGSLLALIDNIVINDSTLTADVSESSFADFLTQYGVKVNFDIAYDVRSLETINFSSGDGMRYLLPYPFWPRAVQKDTSSPITSNISQLVLPWPSSITLDENILSNQGFSTSTLYSTTQFGGTQAGAFNIAPDNKLVPDDLGEQTLAVSLLIDDPDAQNTSRIVVVGDSDFLSEQFATSSNENFAFGLSSIAWLSQEESLAKIQLKQRTLHPLTFQDSTQPQLVKYGNMLLAFMLPFVLGSTRLLKRRNLRNQKYNLHL